MIAENILEWICDTLANDIYSAEGNIPNILETLAGKWESQYFGKLEVRNLFSISH